MNLFTLLSRLSVVALFSMVGIWFIHNFGMITGIPLDSMKTVGFSVVWGYFSFLVCLFVMIDFTLIFRLEKKERQYQEKYKLNDPLENYIYR